MQKIMKSQNVVCVKCGIKATVDLNGARPYNKTTRAYWCITCVELAVKQINQGIYNPHSMEKER